MTHPSRPRTRAADVIAWAHNETSTGVMVPVARPAGAGDALVLIDGTSGAGGLPLDAGQADVYYFAPQKGFASDGGLWLALVSPAALERIEEIASERPTIGPERWIPEFLSLKTALENSVKDQTYNTPGDRDAAAARRPARVDARSAAGSTRWSLGRASPRPPVRVGRGATRMRRRSSRDPAKRSLVVGTIDFADEVDAGGAGRDAARERDRRRRAVPQARAQPAADRDVPGDRSDDVGRSPLASTGSWSGT